MFHMSWSSPYKGEIKTLRFRKNQDPKWHGIGIRTDADGNRWDVHCIFGTEDGCFIQARPYSDCDFRYSTASFGLPSGFVSTTWIPYKVELVEDLPVEMP